MTLVFTMNYLVVRKGTNSQRDLLLRYYQADNLS
jgi:hypothetical protein